MKESTKNKLRRIRLWYIKITARYDRGKTQFGRFNDVFQLSVMVGLGITLWNDNFARHRLFFLILPKIPMDYLVWGIVGLIMFYLVWGQIDQRILKITQAEAEYNYTFLNPYLMKCFDEIKKGIKEIKEKLNARCKRTKIRSNKDTA